MLTLGVMGTARAEDDGSVPDSCKLHPTKTVNPGCLPALTEDLTEPVRMLPNLVPDIQQVLILRPFEWDPATETWFQLPPNLHFDTWSQNLGPAPMQTTVEEIESPESSTVSQCMAWTADRICREQQQVGGYTWHAEHEHFHFEEFAQYEFRRLAVDGRPDYSAAGAVGFSDKVSFCFMDSRQVDPNAFPVQYYRDHCTPTVQGISPGWSDVYGWDLEGQSYPIGTLTDGRYALVVRMNYANRLAETDMTDNTVEITIEISNNLTDVQIIGRYYP